MKRAGVLGLAVLFACMDWVGPGRRDARFLIVPVFSEAGVTALNDLDRLRVLVLRIPSNAVAADTVAAVDSTGAVDLDITVPLHSDPEEFRILLRGFRSTVGDTLYAGEDTVNVRAGGGTPSEAQIPVSYRGPCPAVCTVTAAPQDSLVAAGTGWTIRTTVDSLGTAKTLVPVRFTNLSPSLISVSTDGRVSAPTGGSIGPARVEVAIPSDKDTLRLVVVGPGGTPAVVIVTPGLAALRTVTPNNTIQLADTVKDTNGSLLSPTLATWLSRGPSVATVSTSGLVTAVARGQAVIVAQAAAGVADSMVVAVGDPSSAPGDMAVLAASDTGVRRRAFGTRPVGQRLAVEIVLEQLAAAGGNAGSYNARFTWDATKLRYDSTAAGARAPGDSVAFPAPTVNPDTAAAGVLRFAAVDANGTIGRRVLARLWFTALAQGSDNHVLQILELSGVSPNFTNYFSATRFIVVSGVARITP